MTKEQMFNVIIAPMIEPAEQQFDRMAIAAEFEKLAAEYPVLVTQALYCKKKGISVSYLAIGLRKLRANTNG